MTDSIESSGVRGSEECGVEIGEQTRDCFVGDFGEGGELGEAGVGLLDEPLQEREDEFGFGLAQDSIVWNVGFRGCGECDECVAELGTEPVGVDHPDRCDLEGL